MTTATWVAKYLNGVDVDDVENARNTRSDAEEKNRQHIGVAGADLSESAEQSSTKEIYAEGPLAAEKVNG